MNHYFPGVGLVSIIMDCEPQPEYTMDARLPARRPAITSYPSPEPAPPPQEVVSAQEVIKYRMNCFMEDNDIHIKIKDNLSNTSYSEVYSKDGKFWSENKIYFQDNFERFYEILKDCFEGNNTEIKVDINSDHRDKLQIILLYHGLFDFRVIIDIPKEEDEIDRLKTEINDLKEQNKKMESKVNSLCDFVNDFITGRPISDKCHQKREMIRPGKFEIVEKCIHHASGQADNGCYCTKPLLSYGMDVIRSFQENPEHWDKVKKLKGWDI